MHVIWHIGTTISGHLGLQLFLVTRQTSCGHRMVDTGTILPFCHPARSTGKQS